MAVHRKVYRFRMEPTRAQAEALLRMAGARRFVWNWGLARRKEAYAATGKGLTYNQQAAELTALKKRPEMAWLVQKYDGLCIEDLNLKGMAKTKLSLSVLDAALGEFRRQLEYKSIWYRKHLAVIDRYFPSSRLCRECGAINTALTLSERVWTCECGAVHDRDLNAAQNIRAEGIRKIPVAVGHTETLNAWGEGVRPAHCRLSSLNQESHRL